MFKFIKNLLGLKPKAEVVVPQAPYKIEPPEDKVLITRIAVPESNLNLKVTPAEPKVARAKDTKGRFKADDPSTPDVNEAWKGGKAPAKKSKPAATEGKTKGGNGAVKKPNPNNRKPKGPAKPKAKK